MLNLNLNEDQLFDIGTKLDDFKFSGVTKNLESVLATIREQIKHKVKMEAAEKTAFNQEAFK